MVWGLCVRDRDVDESRGDAAEVLTTAVFGHFDTFFSQQTLVTSFYLQNSGSGTWGAPQYDSAIATQYRGCRECRRSRLRE